VDQKQMIQVAILLAAGAAAGWMIHGFMSAAPVARISPVPIYPVGLAAPYLGWSPPTEHY